MNNKLKYAILAALSLAPFVSPVSHADYIDDAGTTVYTLSNAVNNQVLAYTIDGYGHTKLHKYNTGGQGTAAGLGSQGVLAVSADQNYLFAVNAGSNEVSVFKIEKGNLVLLDHQVEPGKTPVSVTVSNDIVYVVNSGDDSIFGFKFDKESESLIPITNSYVKLTDAGAGEAEIAFNTDGDTVVITEKNVNKISSFLLDYNGVPVGAPNTLASSGQTPFGFMFGKHENLFVSEAGGGANGSTISSYRLNQDGTLAVIDGKVATTQSAACWVATTPNGRLAFTANAASNSIAAFAIDQAGNLSLVNATAATPKHPLDLIVSKDGSVLFSLNNGENTIGVHSIDQSGNLNFVSSIAIPAGATGLVVSQ